jgi:hypothetical protein
MENEAQRLSALTRCADGKARRSSSGSARPVLVWLGVARRSWCGRQGLAWAAWRVTAVEARRVAVRLGELRQVLTRRSRKD